MTDRRRFWALAIICMTILVASIDGLILVVALPTLARDLNASTSELQWIVDGYTLVFAGLMIVGGSLGDRFGRARVMRIGLAIFGLASLAATVASDATTLVLCRAAMGVGASMLFPVSVAIISHLFTEPRERGRALGIWSAVGGVGVALGPVLGGLLLSEFWWGSIFLVNVPIVIGVLIIGRWVIPESKSPDAARFDPLGVVLSVLGIGGLVWATIHAPSSGWGSAETLAGFVAAGLMLVGFVLWELRCDHPMLDLQLFKDPRFSVASLASALANFTFAGALFVLTQLLQSVFGYSPLGAGTGLLPFALAFIVAGTMSSRLAERLGTKRSVSLGLLIFAIGMGSLAGFDVGAGYLPVGAVLAAMGFGFGLVIAPTTHAVMNAAPPAKSGVASGTLSTSRQCAQAIGVAVIGSLLVSTYQSRLASGIGDLGLSAARRAQVRTSISRALEVADRLGGGAGRVLRERANEAFVDGMRVGAVVGAGVLLLSVLLALRYLPTKAHDGAAPMEHAQLDVLID